MALENNPFAPTSGVSGGEDPPPPREDVLEAVPLDPGEILSRCWYLFTNNIGIVLGAMLLPILPAFVFGAISGGLDAAVEYVDPNVAIALSVCSFVTDPVVNNLVSLFFSLGAIRIYLHLARGQSAELSMLVSEGRSYLSGLGAAIIMALLWVAALSPLGAATAYLAPNREFETLGIIAVAYIMVLFVPAIMVSTGTQFMLYTAVDRQLGPWAAIVESWRLTDGHKMSIFVVNLVIGLFALVVTCFTLGFGALLLGPTMVLTQSVMYHSLTHLYDIKNDGIW